jgi:hypothetical protein
VIVARKLPEAEPVQNNVDVPDPPPTLVGVTLHRRSAELVPTVNETVPVKPLSDATVMVDWPLVPVVTEILVGLMVIAKSCM